ncbi:hypothetical protein [Nocardia beijingensis]|uniref:hypothetical protein n=1 Tax=Nocardia beijingensis TaxID=95162 RepID=UPI002B4AFC0D|nr:hypothetical protein [Nocardia beijingensis]
MVAWITAAEHPERVRSLMAVSVPHPGAFAAALCNDPAQQSASTYMDFFRLPTPIPENKILPRGHPQLPAFRQRVAPSIFDGSPNRERSPRR